MEDFALFLVPISLFVATATVIGLGISFRHRGRAEVQQTIRAALEHGQPLSPEVLNALGSELTPSPQADLRRGVMACAVGLGIAAFGVLTEDDLGMTKALVGVGALSLLIGIAYLGLWKFSPRE